MDIIQVLGKTQELDLCQNVIKWHIPELKLHLNHSPWKCFLSSSHFPRKATRRGIIKWTDRCNVHLVVNSVLCIFLNLSLKSNFLELIPQIKFSWTSDLYWIVFHIDIQMFLWAERNLALLICIFKKVCVSVLESTCGKCNTPMFWVLWMTKIAQLSRKQEMAYFQKTISC